MFVCVEGCGGRSVEGFGTFHVNLLERWEPGELAFVWAPDLKVLGPGEGWVKAEGA